ncbi:MAG: hisS [Bacteroidota bacterium]|nr:hisS [Bacteroidota bacterium]
MTETKKIKPALSKGTRDFLPAEVAKRNYIFDTIKSVFRKYGFEEIETPAIERLETLTGKYGEEGDKLLFKILNSGDFLKDAPKEELAAGNSQTTLKYIAEKGLRYDLTVPLARYVVQHQDELAFPFKRFHIGPVWRADRPQKGRYQEFYQCDADVIGSTSLLNEVELTQIYVEVFQLLGLKVKIRLNHRNVLTALIRSLDISEGIGESFLPIMDKYDKIGAEGVRKELSNLNVPEAPISMILHIMQEKDLDALSDFFSIAPEQKTGIAEIRFVLDKVNSKNVFFDTSLVRGLNYYTGVIWEVESEDVKIGSIASGGRYDNLTEMFGAQNMPGVGISFGIERIYDVMEELKLFPETISQGVKVLFVPRDEKMEDFTFKQVQALRDAGIPAEIFLGNVKKQKQFKYVEDKKIAYIVEIGENEQQSGKYRLRNTITREMQNDVGLQDIIQLLK